MVVEVGRAALSYFISGEDSVSQVFRFESNHFINIKFPGLFPQDIYITGLLNGVSAGENSPQNRQYLPVRTGILILSKSVKRKIAVHVTLSCHSFKLPRSQSSWRSYGR